MGNLSNKLLSNHAVVSNADMPLWLLNILEHCDWDIRFQLALLSKQWRNNARTKYFYRFLCQRLSIERALYIPVALPPKFDWKTLFTQMYALRDLWGVDVTANEEASKLRKETWKIQVFARFRPFDTLSVEEEAATPGVVLPLHQRLAMIRMNRKLRKGQSALKVLVEEGGWFQDKWLQLSTASVGKSEEDKDFYTSMDHCHVPHGLKHALSTPKHENKIVSKVISTDPTFGRVVMMTPDSGLREFSFDSVLGASTSQKMAYELSTKTLVMDMLNGFNATAVVYGQTGTVTPCSLSLLRPAFALHCPA